tara:strand:+ start:818 stop:1009 length:192 start_codon:yes stop_codon:yes gene_type:complete
MGYKTPDLKEDIKADIRDWILYQYWDVGEFTDFFAFGVHPRGIDPLVDEINAIVDKHFDQMED